MNDTSPEIAAMVHARLMAKTGEERFLMGVRMHEAARRMVMASFPPGISDQQQKRILFERFYGNEIRSTRTGISVLRSLGEGGCSMKISEDVRQYAAEQGLAEEEAIARGMEEKSKEFVEKGAEVYTPA
ncbi:hypothetical protein OKA05_15850 [Luteolibacter arcticus]|uniref:Uncharacterized protein n=1 Tax=Luteolibacter arcticus TaxID=1581411 RepID=A0ABT3GKQ4_9BACT|nr:hypothetical protein [Luteolibacter arcticus]MCW1924041.1 hypothetical protein [Luteolibacter arcticus]